jgi:hypothetical protein
MTNASSDGQIYPKKYFSEAPTWFVWNKLTAKDVFVLREEPGFEGTHLPPDRQEPHHSPLR